MTYVKPSYQNYSSTIKTFAILLLLTTFTIQKAKAVKSSIKIVQHVSAYGLCDGSLKTINTQGNSPFSYLWSNGNTAAIITDLCEGTYTVTVTDALGATFSKSNAISVVAALKPEYTKIEVSVTDTNDGAIIWNTTGGTPPYRYLWNDGVTIENRTGLQVGMYTVTVADDAGAKQKVYITWASPGYQQKEICVTQLHIHGWSNHNGSGKPGSLQYHIKQADSVNLGVLWWTEHHDLFKPESFTFPFTGAKVDLATLDIKKLTNSIPKFPNEWKCLSKEGISMASINGDTLHVSIESAPTASNYNTFSYTPRYNGELINRTKFVKPLASRPALKFMLLPSFGNSANTQIQFVFKTSYNLINGQERRYIITYILVDSSFSASTVTNGLDSVTVVMPVINNVWQQVQLDISGAAEILPLGIDNTLSDYEMKLLSRNGSIMEAQITKLQLLALQQNTDSIVVIERSVLDAYDTIYHPHNILGVEYSGSQHMNSFFPDSVQNLDIFRGSTQGAISNWTKKVHDSGGLVSYNHLFGTGWEIDKSQVQNYRSDTMTKHLLAVNAYDADMLEVGYYKRGGTDLDRHVITWDKLTANGLFLFGIGTSDAHGNLWMNRLDLFHTFIYSKDSSSYELLHALAVGHMFFGNYKLFNSSFYYTVGNLEMGDRGFATTALVKPVVFLDPLPAKCKVKLTQVLLSKSPILTYLHKETLVNIKAMPFIDVSQPCFIRFTIYDSLGYPLAYGQPIVVLGMNGNKKIETQAKEEVSVTVFPNPANESINIELNFIEYGNYDVRILDSKGDVVKQVDNRYFFTGKYGYRIDTYGLASGTYIVNVTSNNSTYSRKVIVQ